MGGRDTILLGDQPNQNERNERRQLFFAEPNSGRFTSRKVTGHVGGRSLSKNRVKQVEPIRSSRLPPPSQRLDKIVKVLEQDAFKFSSVKSCNICGGGMATSRVTQGRRRCGGCSSRVANGGARGASLHTNASLAFAGSLRGDRLVQPDYKDWRRTAGFPDERPFKNPNSGLPLPDPRLVERTKIGFRDRGLRRFDPNWGGWTSHTLEEIDVGPGPASKTSYMNDKQRTELEAAGGPSGPPMMVEWDRWKRKVELDKHYIIQENEGTMGKTGLSQRGKNRQNGSGTIVHDAVGGKNVTEIQKQTMQIAETSAPDKSLSQKTTSKKDNKSANTLKSKTGPNKVYSKHLHKNSLSSSTPNKTEIKKDGHRSQYSPSQSYSKTAAIKECPMDMPLTQKESSRPATNERLSRWGKRRAALGKKNN